MYSKELIKGNLRTIVLKLLAENGRMYGYEMTSKTKEMTNGKIVLTEGALYPTLHKLQSEGFLTVETLPMGKRIRKYYKLTARGMDESVRLTTEYMDFVQTMLYLLNPSLVSRK